MSDHRKMIAGISSMATRRVLDDLSDAYEASAGIRPRIEAVGGVEAARRIERGEPFDFVVLAADAIERLIAAGRVVRGSRTDVARSGMAMAIAAGTTRPEVGDESALRDAIMKARSVGYSTGPSGAHLMRLFERWGIAEAIAPRLVQAPPGVAVGSLIARGEVELGFQQLSELKDLPGVDVIGMLPPGIQVMTVFSAGACTASTRAGETRAFLSFLASPEADATKRHRGMEPA